MSPNVQALANLLRRKAGLGDELPVDLDGIIEWCGLRCDDVPLDGCLGVYVPVEGGSGGILVREGQYHGQRRFTVGHEIGHFVIPTHQGGALCLDEDVTRPASDQTQEQEANDFAAELLMPRHLFSSEIRGQDPSFGTVRRLASGERYDVSMTACALRLVKLTREACALVVSCNCVFRAMRPTYSEGRGPLIPSEEAHPFRGKGPPHSDGRGPAIA